jgi:hypothetical protein
MTGAISSACFCDCCIAPAPRAPMHISNRSGLSQIGFRIGTFATFREASLERINAEPALAALTTRDSDDYAITLFELSAAVGDVLSFYNERIANELFLRTAQERDSILRLVRLIGYRLRSGLAARTWLAFTLDAGARVRIRRGLKVMSLPAQDEQPQIFENLEQIAAHGDLNRVPGFAPPTLFNAFQTGKGDAPLASAPSPLMPADRLVLFGRDLIEEKTVTALPTGAGGDRLQFAPPVQTAFWWPGVAWAEKAVRRLRFFGHNLPDNYQSYDAGPTVSPLERWTTTPIAHEFAPGQPLYPLDARYEDLRPGTRLLIDAGPGAAIRLVSAVAVDTAERHAVLGSLSPTATPALSDTVTHVRLCQTIRGLPAPVAVSSGHRVMARTGTGAILDFNSSDPSPVPSSIGDFVGSSDISAVSPLPDRIDVFIRSAAALVATATWTLAGWSPWTELDGPVTSNPAALALAGGELVVFARGIDGGLWLSPRLPAAGPWMPLGGIVGSDPVPVTWGGGHIDLFVRGADRALWVISRDGGSWSEWHSLEGVLAGAPAAASVAFGRLDVVALGDSGNLLHRRWDGAMWSDWLDLGGRAQGVPAIVATGPDRVDVFVWGGDGQLWQIARTGNDWSGWIALGGALGSAPAALAVGAQLFVYARDADGALVRRVWAGGGWQPWMAMPAGIEAIPDRRQVRIYQLAAEQITFRGYDYPPFAAGGRIALRLPQGGAPGGLSLLAKGRRIVLETDAGPMAATVAAATPWATSLGDPPDHLLVDFAPNLPTATAGLALRGNVAMASHGETQPDEPLGNADAAVSFAQFRLSRSPLTYIASPADIAGTAELQIQVNDELWQEAPSLYARGPTERIYTARQSDAGDTYVTFGDGKTGARLPSGAMNVVAHYRTGSGLAGDMQAGQLSILLERPVGLRAVANPLAADGGADPEPRDKARSNAPTTVRTFGRAVSLEDFEWLATSSGLVARAYVTWVWHALQRAVHLTVAGPNGAVLSPASMDLLYDALTAARDPNRQLFLANLVRVPLVVGARLLRDPAFTADFAFANATAVLSEAFSFEAMALGAAVHASHVMAVLQSARGVTAVGLDLFQLKGFAALSTKEREVRAVTADPVQDHIRIFPARPTPSDTSLIDRYARAGFTGSPPPVLAAEQAFIETPATDLDLVVVEAL